VAAAVTQPRERSRSAGSGAAHGDHGLVRPMMERARDHVRAVFRTVGRRVAVRLEGGNQSCHGRYFTVENARLYSLPDSPPPLYAGGGRPAQHRAGRLRRRRADRHRSEASLLAAFDSRRRRRQAAVPESAGARSRTMQRRANRDRAVADLGHGEQPFVGAALPQHFDAVAELVTEDHMAESIVCGPDPTVIFAAIRKYAAAGHDHLCIHQIGKGSEGLFPVLRRGDLPQLKSMAIKVHGHKKSARRTRKG
jgi:hypothetical protein